jgi:CubicO group peptidase (beta-lactamase class C family)
LTFSFHPIYFSEEICDMPVGKVNTISADQLLSITRSPGAQWILADGSRIILECNAGFADITTHQPVKPSTTFNAFSVTKTATAAALLRLAEEKKINLNDPVNSILNELSIKFPFTIQQLIAHQAGFPDPIPISWIHLASEEDVFDENSFIKHVIDRHSGQKFLPGTKFSYSSIGYLIIGRIIEKITGDHYANYIRNNIIPQLGDEERLDFLIYNAGDHATGYHPRFSFSNFLLEFFLDKRKFVSAYPGCWMSFNNFYVNGKAYGGFVGNARGLMKYLQSYLSNKMFLNQVTRSLMFTEQKGGMALGWFIGKLMNTDYVCHAGGGGGYYCEIRIYPSLGLASVLLRNKSSFGDLRLLDKIDALSIF